MREWVSKHKESIANATVVTLVTLLIWTWAAGETRETEPSFVDLELSPRPRARSSSPLLDSRGQTDDCGPRRAVESASERSQNRSRSRPASSVPAEPESDLDRRGSRPNCSVLAIARHRIDANPAMVASRSRPSVNDEVGSCRSFPHRPAPPVGWRSSRAHGSCPMRSKGSTTWRSRPESPSGTSRPTARTPTSVPVTLQLPERSRSWRTPASIRPSPRSG